MIDVHKRAARKTKKPGEKAENNTGHHAYQKPSPEPSGAALLRRAAVTASLCTAGQGASRQRHGLIAGGGGGARRLAFISEGLLPATPAVFKWTALFQHDCSPR